ncbi:hypothetical protein ASD74_00695 [Rhizobium sp. Root564]|nr:hypothetical protein ASD74_00695 [Rhizobium sp. Root564]
MVFVPEVRFGRTSHIEVNNLVVKKLAPTNLDQYFSLKHVAKLQIASVYFQAFSLQMSLLRCWRPLLRDML